MQDIRVERRVPVQERRTFASRPPDGAVILDGPVRLLDADTGAVVGFQAIPEMKWATDLARSLRSIRWSGNGSLRGDEVRLSGFSNTHRTFGNSAPVPLRRRYGCSVCEFNREFPRLTQRLGEFARQASGLFRELAPIDAKAHEALLCEIDPAWYFADSLWTSGIINRTSALPYHRDAGNLKGSWSAMLGLRRGVTGGLLHLAEFNVYLTIPDRSITIFDGQGVLHGVTPLRPGGAGSYRYTIVVYAKAGMRGCLTGQAEIDRARRRRTTAEDDEADRLRQRTAP